MLGLKQVMRFLKTTIFLGLFFQNFIYCQSDITNIEKRIREKGKVIQWYNNYTKEIDSVFAYVNLKYPKSAMEQGVSGEVTLQYIQNADCSLKSIEIIKGLTDDCNKEAIRATREMCRLLKKYGGKCEEKKDIIITHEFTLR